VLACQEWDIGDGGAAVVVANRDEETIAAGVVGEMDFRAV
jgi:hypothetical protein